MKKNALVTALFATAVGLPATSMAEGSANFGFVTDYIFRGVFQAESSAFAGADLTHDSGFYIGAWAADVGDDNACFLDGDTDLNVNPAEGTACTGDGIELDYYLGWGGGDDFTYSIGYTWYTYPDNYDDGYEEINLSLGYGIFSLAYAQGKYDNFGNGKIDYDFTSLTISPEMGAYFKLGFWGDDLAKVLTAPRTSPGGTPGKGSYFEAGYAYTFEDAGVDLSMAFTWSDDLPLTPEAMPAGPDYALVFGVKKTIAIGE